MREHQVIISYNIDLLYYSTASGEGRKCTGVTVMQDSEIINLAGACSTNAKSRDAQLSAITTTAADAD